MVRFLFNNYLTIQLLKTNLSVEVGKLKKN